jgi:tryptophan 2,3-dioxygenase
MPLRTTLHGDAEMPEHTYSSYLKLDRLLSSQHLLTDSDDELLFIVIHQAHELWFKLGIHELTCAIDALQQENPGKSGCIMAFKRLSRVSQIQRVLIETWDVLTTLTPDEFHVFRRTIGQNNASGFQSIQYRVLEFKLGLKNRYVYFQTSVDGKLETKQFDVFRNAKILKDQKTLRLAFAQPSVYDAVIYYISNQYPMFNIKTRSVDDYTKQYKKTQQVYNAWKYVYENSEIDPELYQLAEKLIDLEDAFRRWRFTHLATVSRVIGNASGTGGSSGLQYLRQAANQLLDNPMYPELWDVRNAMFSPDQFRLASAGYEDTTA